RHVPHLDGVQEGVAAELRVVQPYRVVELVRVDVREAPHAVHELLVRLREVRGPGARPAPAAPDAGVRGTGEVELVAGVIGGSGGRGDGGCSGHAVGGEGSPFRGAFRVADGVSPLLRRWFNLEPSAHEWMRPRNAPRARHAIAAPAAVNQDRTGLDRSSPEPDLAPTLAPAPAHALAQERERQRDRSRGKT